MPKYLLQASYTAEGAKGILKDGGSKRRQAVEELLKSMGGKVEAFYFSFGEGDAVAIVDAPDNGTVAAHALAIHASGAVNLKTTVLVTPEEIDDAVKKPLIYHAPGQ